MSAFLSRCVALTGLCLLSACATVYQAPPGANAKVVVAGPVTAVFVSDGRSCASRQAVTKDQWTQVPVVAGRPVAVEYWFTKSVDVGTTGCNGAVAFRPQAGGTYTITFKPTFKGMFLSGCTIETQVEGVPAGPADPLGGLRSTEPLAC